MLVARRRSRSHRTPLDRASLGLAALAALAAAVACGQPPEPPPGHDEAGATLAIAPATSLLTIVNGAPATQAFTATVTYPDGFSEDVTDQTSFAIDGSFGAFTGPSLTVATNTGKTVVTGTWHAKQAGAQVIVRLRTQRVDPTLPPGTPDLFGAAAADPGRAPQVVYPPADVLVPRNLGDFEIHWKDPSDSDVYEVSLLTEFTDIRAYVPRAATGPGTWASFLADEWGGAVGVEGTVSYQVRGLRLADPTKVGATPTTLVRLSNENVEGGIYYWASRSSTGLPEGIFRHDMAKPGQPAEQFYTRAQSGDRCVACHVVSRDGKRMAVTYDGGNGEATMVDVATSTAAASAAAWNFAAFTPDGSELIAARKGVLTVRDATTQAVLATVPTGGWATHPDVSPDGKKLVYVRPAATGEDWHFGGGQLYVIDYDQATHAFGTPVALLADGGNNYYPSFSPDGAWVLFNKSTDNNAGTGAYNNASAKLYAIKADGSQPPVELATANLGGGLTNSWGRWAPFAQSFGAQHEPMFWITVSSKREFGVRVPGGGLPQIWMAPFFPARAAAGMDPSAPMFRLPFQNLGSNNHIAQWTTHVITQ